MANEIGYPKVESERGRIKRYFIWTFTEYVGDL
jgi:hypothetical protein